MLGYSTRWAYLRDVWSLCASSFLWRCRPVVFFGPFWEIPVQYCCIQPVPAVHDWEISAPR